MRRTRRTVSVTAVVVAALALLASACSTTEKSATTTTEPKTRTTRGITATAVKVGGVIDDTQFAQGGNGAGARFMRANAEGGVAGRTIDYIGVTSDKRDRNQNADIVKRLVQQDQVALVAPVLTSGFGGADFLAQQGVPYFGWGISREWCNTPYAFGVTGCLSNPNPQQENGAWGVLLQKYFGAETNPRQKTVAIVGVDDDASKLGTKAIAASVRAAGFEVIGPFNDIPTATPPADYTQFAQEVLTSNAGKQPDVVLEIMPFNDVNGITKKLNDLGFTGLYVSAVGYDPQLLKVPAFQKNFLVALQWAPYESSAAAIQQMKQDFAAYDQKNNTKTPLNLANAASYWAADVVVAALEKTGQDLTVEKLVAALNGGFSFSQKDALGEVQFPENHEVPVPCLSGVQIKSGAYQEVVPLTCAGLVPVK